MPFLQEKKKFHRNRWLWPRFWLTIWRYLFLLSSTNELPSIYVYTVQSVQLTGVKVPLCIHSRRKPLYIKRSSLQQYLRYVSHKYKFSSMTPFLLYFVSNARLHKDERSDTLWHIQGNNLTLSEANFRCCSPNNTVTTWRLQLYKE